MSLCRCNARECVPCSSSTIPRVMSRTRTSLRSPLRWPPESAAGQHALHSMPRYDVQRTSRTVQRATCKRPWAPCGMDHATPGWHLMHHEPHEPHEPQKFVPPLAVSPLSLNTCTCCHVPAQTNTRMRSLSHVLTHSRHSLPHAQHSARFLLADAQAFAIPAPLPRYAPSQGSLRFCSRRRNVRSGFNAAMNSTSRRRWCTA
jgi:hypothetical protein